uniref:Uncharacterized protein n=1 Tax=Timema shepardi TaxID=629360 RepID=A0A7R9FWH6_TIMSH|nr:unnamed protein product [Timema shepardi]
MQTMLRANIPKVFPAWSNVRSLSSDPQIDSIIRVDHAGELGADRIYAGQIAVLGSALLGPKAAMACTVAVESVIVDHYNDQLRTLMSDPEKNKELLDIIQKFRDDEQEHHDTGLEQGAEQTPFYNAFTEVIKLGCKVAINISKVI